MKLCRNCIEELRSRGEKVLVNDDPLCTLDEAEALEAEGLDPSCDGCGEYDDLYLCIHIEL